MKICLYEEMWLVLVYRGQCINKCNSHSPKTASTDLLLQYSYSYKNSLNMGCPTVTLTSGIQ